MSSNGEILRAAVLAAALLIPVGKAAGQQPARDSLAGVSGATIEEGRTIYVGPGLCTACHGADGKGGLGPNLTDRAWLHGRGEYAEIVDRITRGVPPDSSKTGQIMPARGGATLTNDQVRAVAAYVWTLSRKTKPR